MTWLPPEAVMVKHSHDDVQVVWLVNGEPAEVIVGRDPGDEDERFDDEDG